MKINNGYILAACLVLLVSLAAGCGGGGGGGSIKITSTQVTAPTSFLGGPVTVRIEATAGGGISAVRVDVTEVSTGTVKSTAMLFDGVRYAGSVNVPTNSTTSGKVYNVVVTVSDNSGHSSTATSTFTIPAPTGPPANPF